MINTYANGSTTSIPTITGASLAHRNLTPSQLAVLAAEIADGFIRFEPTLGQIATMLGVSPGYMAQARKLTQLQRESVFKGWRSIGELLECIPPALPKPVVVDLASLTNMQLENVVRAVGIDRILNAASVVDQAAA